ncbi:MAG TPA: MFS transporter [Blastocatellia bacterium]|nr:MFS transporter [Blastocatellia bacterium]
MNHKPATETVITTKPRPETPVTTRYAYFVLALLAVINLLNYIDRTIVAAVETDIQAALKLNDEQFGEVLAILIISYTVLSPLFGRLGDKGDRRRLIAIGIAIWSIATALAGLAQSYHQLLLARSLIGVGEASYATIAPSLISDVFPKEKRGTALGIFFAAIPLGFALGYILGGLAPYFDQSFGLHRGWRPTMFIVGGPGLVMAAITYWFMKEPKRGAFDEDDTTEVDEGELLKAAPQVLVRLHESFVKWLNGLPEGFKKTAIGGYLVDRLGIYTSSFVVYAGLLTVGTFLLASLGYTALTFGLGALSNWVPKFLEVDKGLDPRTATKSLGLIILIAGFIGTFSGGAISDWLLKYTKRAYFFVCGVTVLIAVVPSMISFASPNQSVYLSCIFISVTLLFMGNAPVNAIIVNSVAPNLRASAVALNILMIHVMGDAVSGVAVGSLSTSIEQHAANGTVPGFVSSIAHMFSLNPATQHLSIALLITPVAMAIGGVFFLIGTRTVK